MSKDEAALKALLAELEALCEDRGPPSAVRLSALTRDYLALHARLRPRETPALREAFRRLLIVAGRLHS